MNHFSKEIFGDVVIESVNLQRATMRESEEFKKILLKDINDGYVKIIVDLTNCGFMDSTFLGTLVIALKEVIKKGGDLKISAAHSDTQAILEITGTAKIFEQYTSIKEAVESFRIDSKE